MPSAIPKKGESLWDRFEELSDEWHPSKNSPLTPKDVKPGSTKSVWWICKSEHEWTAKVRDRSAGRGCPICSNRQVLAGYNDLASTNQALAKQADGWDPTRTTEKSGKIVNWKCELGHSWKAQIASRSYGAGCPVCSGNNVLAGFNDLATTNPDLAVEADGWDPTTVSSGSNQSVDWHGKCGHSWRSIVVNRIRGSGCPICAGKSVLVGFNDLATTNPEIAGQADGWDPTTVATNSHKKVSWKCELGHSWKTAVASRSNGTGCPICSGNTVLAGFNDLATTNPDLAAEADGWDPRTVSKSSSRKQKWICNKGHKWIADPAHRSAGRGCPSCTISGFDPNQDSYLYFIDHFDLNMFQIGITNHPTKRLDKHGRSGWEVIELRGPMDGHLTQQLETLCLQALEKRGAILGHKAGINKFDGYSEAWTKASLHVKSIKQILDWVYEDETK